MSNLAKYAQRYAKFGWPVLPCFPGTKYPATTNGVKDATTDLEQIARWWRENPDYNIGLAAGFKFDVVDLDGDEGRETWQQYADQTKNTLRVRTPNGEHYYFKPFGATNKVRCLPGVDLRGSGGYVIAPPSVGVSGAQYEWINPPVPGGRLLKFEVPINVESNVTRLDQYRPAAEPPDGRLFTTRFSEDYAGCVLKLMVAKPGNRNATLFREACYLYDWHYRGHVTEWAIQEGMLTAGRYVGLEDSEIERTLASAKRTVRKAQCG